MTFPDNEKTLVRRQGLFIFTLSVAEGSKVLACIPFFILAARLRIYLACLGHR